MTLDEWVDAGCPQLGGEDKTLWVRSADGSRLALSKPGPDQPPSNNALHEYLASIIAHWIGVKVPRVELYVLDNRPVALSMKAPGQTIDWSQLMCTDDYIDQRQTALSRLNALANTIVLEAFLGIGNRPGPPKSHGNHVYVVDEQTWYSIDYADAFRENFNVVEHQPQFVEEVLKAPVEIDHVLRRSKRFRPMLCSISLRPRRHSSQRQTKRSRSYASC
jgi:hypothetical protein